LKKIRNISNGAFGTVDEIELDDGSRVARKTFDPANSSLTHEERRKLILRFQREANVQSALSSKAFVEILEKNLTIDPPYYFMPLATRNFSKEISDFRNGITNVIPALFDILNGLDELHELGFVHRDLKPANVLKIGDSWKLSDFGLVLPPDGATVKLTSTGSNWGTEDYCAPEQRTEFANATPAVDIYAFGCILHDIYVGARRVPYGRHSGANEIGLIIEKCTEVKPEKRFKSIRSLRSALQSAMSNADTAMAASAGASDWLSALQSVATWDRTKLKELLRFLATASDNDIYALMTAVDEEVLDQFCKLDTDYFKSFALSYTEWIQNFPGFGWSFCDVLIRRLEKVYELGDIETKAASIMAAAQTGLTAGRWFVMNRLVGICGPGMNDTIARRVEIEIRAQEAEGTFHACARAVGKDATAFHPRIMIALNQSQAAIL